MTIRRRICSFSLAALIFAGLILSLKSSDVMPVEEVAAVYNPNRESVKTQSTVSFLNYDGTLLYTGIFEDGGEVPRYPFDDPVKPSDNTYEYVFDGWDNENLLDSLCNSVISVTARYTALPRRYDNSSDTFSVDKITINNSEFYPSESLCARLYDVLRHDEKDSSFYMIDLQTEMSVGYNSDRTYNSASAIKAGMALCAYKMLEEGRLSFDDILTYLPSHYCYGTGIICYDDFGTQFTLEDILHLMIYESDNVAYYMLCDYVGYEDYNAMLDSLGCKHGKLSQSEKWTNLSTHDLGLIWKEIYRFYDSGAYYGKIMFDEFLCAKYNFVKSALGYKKIAHKSGYNICSYCDAAVVFASRTYVFVLINTPIYDDSSADQNYFAEIALLTDDVMEEYNQWTEKQPVPEPTR